jgi:chitin synthase
MANLAPVVAHTRSIFMFAICQGLLLYCAGYTVYQTVPHTTAGWSNVKALFSNRTFLDLALSLMVSTFYALLHRRHRALTP